MLYIGILGDLCPGWGRRRGAVIITCYQWCYPTLSASSFIKSTFHTNAVCEDNRLITHCRSENCKISVSFFNRIYGHETTHSLNSMVYALKHNIKKNKNTTSGSWGAVTLRFYA